MARSANANDKGIGSLFQTIVRLTLIGGVLGTIFVVIQNILLNLTGLETGITALDALISGGLTLVVGYLLLSDVLETIVPGIKKKIGF